ncbi:MAG: hypothetical protein K9L74_03065 [Candidatus Izimaplasma sp.]|nr:hypothetical protein [Candidatus Izimaplasma bacterium]
MDDRIYRDYASWKLETHDLIEKFKEKNSLIYERFEPIIVVLDYIYNQVCDEQGIDDDLKSIFQIGFHYIYEQFELIKIYFEKIFDSDWDDFLEYSELLLYLLFILDFRKDIETSDVEYDEELFSNLEVEIEDMIMDRQNNLTYIHDRVNEVLRQVDEQIDYQYESIVDIFVEIAETLGIFIYEEDTFVVGEDI